MSNDQTRLSWRRIMAEGLVIVTSILLALAADAWWDGRADRAARSALLESLETEFTDIRNLLANQMEGLAVVVQDGAALRDITASSDQSSTEVPARLICSAISAPLFRPAATALEAALSAGTIALLDSQPIERQLRRWRMRMNYLERDQDRILEITDGQVIPLLSREFVLAPYFPADGDFGCQTDVPATIAPSLELSGALALRYSYVQRDHLFLGVMYAELDQLLATLAAQER